VNGEWKTLRDILASALKPAFGLHDSSFEAQCTIMKDVEKLQGTVRNGHAVTPFELERYIKLHLHASVSWIRYLLLVFANDSLVSNSMRT